MFILCFVPLDFIAVVECLEFPILLPEGVEVVGPAQFPPVLHWSVYLAWPLVTTLIIQIDKNLSTSAVVLLLVAAVLSLPWIICKYEGGIIKVIFPVRLK